MLTRKVNLKIIQPALVKTIAGSLKIGRVVVLPTDTIYGLSCRADDAKAVRRIKRLKGRDAKKPLIVLVSDFKMLKKYAALGREQEKFLRRIWGRVEAKLKPTTVILKSKNNLPLTLIGPGGSLAVRLPKSKFLIKIIGAVKRPLVSTSLNLSGQPPLSNLRRLTDYFSTGQTPDLVVDAGPSGRTKPSRLIDLRGERPIVLRK